MIVLVSKSPVSLERYRCPHLGILATPRATPPTGRLDGWVWAMDNDAYSGFDEGRYMRMLERYADTQGGLRFVTAPDVVADAEQTLDLFGVWEPVLRGYGYPVGLVGQDGMVPGDIEWDKVSALFVGGSTEWKLGGDALALIRVAQGEGKWVHMGRVNTRRRVEYAMSVGCDSVDGSAAAKWTATHLPWMLDMAGGVVQGGLL